MTRPLFHPHANLWLFCAYFETLCALVACNHKKNIQRTTASRVDKTVEHKRAQVAKIAQEFPLYGQVDGLQLAVRAKADPESELLGWLRLGGQIHLKDKKTPSPGCRKGWYPVYPKGWVCVGQGVRLTKTPATQQPAPAESSQVDSAQPDDSQLPYRYYFVRDVIAPEYHRLPTRREQMYIHTFTERFRALKALDPKKAEALLAGELPNEPAPPHYVRRFIQRGFYIATLGSEKRGSREFARTLSGSYVWRASLEERKPSSFKGVEINASVQLPVAWVVRTAIPLVKKTKWDGSLLFRRDQEATPIERYSIVQILGEELYGTKKIYKIAEERYLHLWFLAVARLQKPPRGLKPDEVWIHIDRGQQTLVLYRGATPLYATLVSTGLPEHPTPEGTYRLRTKRITDTMADIGADIADDRYRIEDVPWTQYFRGSLAIHGAFWHDRFGLQRSHGCVNVAPADAAWLFDKTLPEVPPQWHGISALPNPRYATLVLIT